jgi:hypothetical protein
MSLPLSSALAWLLLGVGWGYAHFAALRRGVGRLVQGRSGVLALLLARLCLAALALGTAAHRGAAPLLALFAGFLFARHRALRAAKRQSAAAQGLS